MLVNTVPIPSDVEYTVSTLYSIMKVLDEHITDIMWKSKNYGIPKRLTVSVSIINKYDNPHEQI